MLSSFRLRWCVNENGSKTKHPCLRRGRPILNWFRCGLMNNMHKRFKRMSWCHQKRILWLTFFADTKKLLFSTATWLYIPQHSWLPENSVPSQTPPVRNRSLAISVYLGNTNSSLKSQLRDHLLQEAFPAPYPFPCIPACCPHLLSQLCFQVCFISLWPPLGEPRTQCGFNKVS